MVNISVSALNPNVYSNSSLLNEKFCGSENSNIEKLGYFSESSDVDRAKAEYDRTCDLYLHCDNPQNVKEYEEEMDKAYRKWQIALKKSESASDESDELNKNNAEKRAGSIGDFIKNSGKKLLDILVKYVI